MPFWWQTSQWCVNHTLELWLGTSVGCYMPQHSGPFLYCLGFRRAWIGGRAGRTVNLKIKRTKVASLMTVVSFSQLAIQGCTWLVFWAFWAVITANKNWHYAIHCRGCHKLSWVQCCSTSYKEGWQHHCLIAQLDWLPSPPHEEDVRHQTVPSLHDVCIFTRRCLCERTQRVWWSEDQLWMSPGLQKQMRCHPLLHFVGWPMKNNVICTSRYDHSAQTTTILLPTIITTEIKCQQRWY